MNEVVDEIYENETAEELYERIQREKERLISEGKLKKQKKLPEISEDEIPFEIPKSWKWVFLYEIADIYTGNSISENLKKNIYSQVCEGYDYIGTKDINFDGKINYNTGLKVPFNEQKFKKAYKNSVLMCIEGGSAGKKITFLDKEVCFVNKLCSFNIIIANPRYIYYFFKSPIFNMFFNSKLNGLIGGVSILKLKTIHIPLPPLSEQKRISELIDRLFEKLDEAKEKALSALNTFELRKAKILHLAIQGKLSKQLDEYKTAEELYEKIQIEKEKLISEGKLKKQKKLPEISQDEIPFEIPKSWKWVRLGEIGESSIGLTYKPSDISNSDGIVVLRSNNIKQEKLDYSDLIKVNCYIPDTKMCKLGDILICARNGSKKMVGKVALIDKEGMSFGAFMSIYRSKCNKYIFYLMQSSYYKNIMLKNTNTTTINQIRQDDLKNYIIPLPPLEEQEQIVRLLDDIFEKEEKAKKLIESTLNKIELIKKSILARAVRGEL